MDDADRADERIQNILDGQIAIAREKAAKVRALVPCNACFYCNSYVDDGFVFCDKDCQADYTHEKQRKKELGL